MTYEKNNKAYQLVKGTKHEGGYKIFQRVKNSSEWVYIAHRNAFSKAENYVKVRLGL